MKRTLLVLLCFFLLHAACNIPVANASVFQIPETGQTISYAAGDDGDLTVGLGWPATRFVDNGETLTDNLTGLIWVKDANLMKTRDPLISAAGTVTWQGALDYVKKLNSENYLGHNDWRLPNIKELSSLINRGLADQVTWLTGQGFTNVQNSIYWSSNTLDGLMKFNAWYIDLSKSSFTYSPNNKSSSSYVLPVRTGPTGEPVTIAKCGKSFCYDSNGISVNCTGTGQDGELQSGAAWPSPRFIDNRDRTLTDKLTGLVWSQSGNTPGPANCAPGAPKTWSAALDYVNCLNTSAWLGKTDWRLPNLNELQSLISYGRFNNSDWLKGQGFATMGINFWSSTTSAADTNIAWGMTDAGSTTNSAKTTNADYVSVWPVRSGEAGTNATLSVAKSGNGTIATSVAGIDCGSTCSANFTSGEIIALTATADSGYAFSGWTGCDSSSGNQCAVIVTGAKNVTATFDLIPAACGSDFGGSFSSSPTADLCASGAASVVTVTASTWNWTCSTGGAPAQCSASRPANSVTTQLPQTGQTVCYDERDPLTNTGVEIPCAGTGQDGDKQAGKPLPFQRFTDNNNGSVTDNLTGLTWLKNANCIWTTWQDALDKVKALKGDGSQCGLIDGSGAGQWRLPNRKEMQSLLDRQRQDPALSIGHPFLGFNSYGYEGRYIWYWTSTYVRPYPSFAYILNMYDGELDREDKTRFTTYAWPVRDSGQIATVQLPRTGQGDCRPAYGDGGTTNCTGTGQDGELLKGAAPPAPRFQENGNGTVTDRLTGLIWLKNAFCTDTVNGISTSVDGYLSWADALAWSNNLGNGPCGLVDNSAPGDWRMPNITELESLIDASQTNPSYPLNAPFTIPNGGGIYWSSTTTAGDGSHVWVMMPGDGMISGAHGYWSYGKGGAYRRTWPVRGGHIGDGIINFAPAFKDFGNVPVGTNVAQVVTISNAGTNSRLQVNAMGLTGDVAQFSLNVGNGAGGTCGSKTPIIPPGGSCTVTVIFIPATEGLKIANLRISSSDMVLPNTDISFYGTPQINGGCGTANGSFFNTAPATNFCTTGDPTPVSGTGPWTWTCAGSGGGTDASCSANINSYSVSFAPGVNGTLIGIASQTINYGSGTSAVTAVPAPNYHFVNWTGSLTSIDNPLAIATVSTTMGFTANFAIDTFAVNFALAGNGSIAGSASQTVDYGADSTTVTAFPNIGYHFVNWTEGGTEVGTSAALTSTSVSAAHDYIANFAINTYSLTFAAGINGALNGALSQSVNYESDATSVTAIPDTNYHFVSWTEGATVVSTNASLAPTLVAANHNYTANFSIDTFPVTFTVSANGTLTGAASQTVAYNTNATTVTAVPNTGYHFVNWTEGGIEVGTSPALDIANVTAGHSYMANFAINTFAVSFTSGSNGSLTGILDQTVPYRSSTNTVTAVPAAGYHLVNWTEGATVVGTGSSLTISSITAAHNYTANFAINGYTVSFGADINGTVTGNKSQSVNYGADATTVTAVPVANYHFVNWTEGTTVVGTSADLSITNIMANHFYTANFAINTYTLDFTASGSGTLTGKVSQTVAYRGNSTTVTAVPGASSHFVNWTEGSTVVGASASLSVSNVTASHSYTANFAINTFVVSFAAVSNGALTGSASQTIAYGGDAATVTAVPADNYHFVNWTEGTTVVGTSPAITVTGVTAAHNYKANFAFNAANGACGTNNGVNFGIAPTVNLCATGTATPVTGTGPWNWQCKSVDGGATANCSAGILSFGVTPLASDGSTISPTTVQTVIYGGTTKFTVVPATAAVGYGIAVTGCGGTLSSSTYTTGPITGDCTVSVHAVARNANGTGAAQPTLADALLALKAQSGKVQLTAVEKIRYDVAPLGADGLPVGNGIVDSADVILILRRTVGIGSW